MKSYFNCSKLTTQQRSEFSPVCLSEDQIKDIMAGKSVSFAESQLLFRLTLLTSLLVGLQLLLYVIAAASLSRVSPLLPYAHLATPATVGRLASSA